MRTQLAIRSLSAGYENKQVVSNVSFELFEGEVVLLVGANGSGKTTLFKAIFGVIPLKGGEVLHYGEKIQGENIRTSPFRMLQRGIMYLPQRNELFEDLTVRENITYSLLHLKDKRETILRVKQTLESLTFLGPVRDRLVSRLSGGERKMVSLGMAYANRPSVLLFDEPLAGLSSENIPQFLNLLEKLRERKTTILFIEHRIRESFVFANRVEGLKLGMLASESLTNLNSIKSFLI